MQKCPKCKSESLYWCKDVSYDPDTKEVILGYWKCLTCSKIVFESKETKQTLTRDK